MLTMRTQTMLPRLLVLLLVLLVFAVAISDAHSKSAPPINNKSALPINNSSVPAAGGVLPPGQHINTIPLVFQANSSTDPAPPFLANAVTGTLLFAPNTVLFAQGTVSWTVTPSLQLQFLDSRDDVV